MSGLFSASALLSSLISLTGCVHYLPAAVSSTSLGGKYEKPLGIASGRSEATYVLFFGPFGEDSLHSAIEDAKKSLKADTLVNVFVDRRVSCFPHCSIPLVSTIETLVYGTAVRYDIHNEDGVQSSAVATAVTTPTSAVPVDENYKRLLIAFNAGDGIREAEKLHSALSKEDKAALQTYVSNEKGNGSVWNWKLRRPDSEVETRFLRWYVTSYTKNAAIFE